MKFLGLLLTILIFSCNSKNHKYFEYDEIEYYKNGITEEQSNEICGNQKKSKTDLQRMGIILGEIPKSIADTSFVENLNSFGYSKSKINSKKFGRIDAIFTERKHSELMATGCIYVYRDILVFRKKSKIIGIAKICFGCGSNVIVGTKSNTAEFGMSGDYEKLNGILNEK